MKISVILVHYNAQKLIEKAILSLWEQEIEAEWEFLITDNSQNLQSTCFQEKGIPFFITDLKYNAGFARGVNQGLKKATGEIIFIVNQDAFLSNKSIASNIRHQLSSLPSKTIMGCSLVDEKGEFQQSVWLEDPSLLREWRKGPINCKINSQWQKRIEDKKRKVHFKSGIVHRINGAFLVFKRPKEINEILFDEDFFLYGEDVEWALRIKKTGWKFYHAAAIVIHHIGSASSSNETTKQNQIKIMDWLVVRKLKGRFYFWLYIHLLQLNSRLTFYLVKRSGDKQMLETVEKSSHWQSKMLKNYFSLILNLKNNTPFFELLNMYKNV